MNRKEQLLIILAEECSEVIKDVTKSLRFGLDDINPSDNHNKTNRENISNELCDLIAVAKMLLNEGYIDDYLDDVKIEKKQNKVEKYLNYSKDVGTLE